MEKHKICYNYFEDMKEYRMKRCGMKLKITTLIENMPDESGNLAYEHGFSVFVEFEGKRILFDTGQSGAFVKNAEALDINLSTADYVVLSHGHYDHTGGVSTLLEVLEKQTSFYMGEEFFEAKYKLLEDGSYKYNGNPFEREILEQREELVKLHYVKNGVTWLTENVVLLKGFDRVTEYEGVNPKFFIKTESGYEQDLFVDEIALGFLTEEGLVLLVGCSHVGIVNILEYVKQKLQIPVVAVLGGTHLVEADEERLVKTAEALKKHGVKKIAVSHCTGEVGMELLRKEFAEEFVLNNTGNVMEF